MQRQPRSNHLAGVLLGSVVMVVLATACASPPLTPTAAPSTPVQAPATAAQSPERAGPVTLPKPELTAIKIGHSALEPNGFPPELAHRAGFYQKYGFDSVETFYFDGSAKTIQALISDQVMAVGNAGGPAFASQLTDTPLQQVTMNITKMTDGLFSRPDVKSGEDLRGKRVAVSQFGGESHAAVLLSLQSLGLTSSDVTIVQIGGQAARIAALQAGSVAAAPIDMSRADEMARQGFHVLVDLRKTDLEFARTGLNFRKEFIEKYPNTVLAMVAANLEAQNFIFTNTQQAIDDYVQWVQAQDKAQAEADMRIYMGVARRDLRWSKQAWDALKEVMVVENPSLQAVDVTSAYSLKFLDQLEQMGLYEALGIPIKR